MTIVKGYFMHCKITKKILIYKKKFRMMVCHHQLYMIMAYSCSPIVV